MKREDCMLIDNPEYPQGMITELNAAISKFLDTIDFENLPEFQQQQAFGAIMFSTYQVAKKNQRFNKAAD